MNFTTNFSSGTKKSSDFPKVVEAFEAIEPSSFETSKQTQTEHTTMFNDSSCFSKSKKHSSRSSFCPQTSGDVSAKTSTKRGLKQMSDSKLKETSKSKGHKLSNLFKNTKAKVTGKHSSLKTRAKSVFGKLFTKSKSKPHTVSSAINRTKTHSSLESEDSKLSIPVSPKACVQNEVYSTSSTRTQGSPKSGNYWVQNMCGFAPKKGSGTMANKHKKPNKTLSKVSATLKSPDKIKGSGFFGTSFLSPVSNRGGELPTKPQTRAFPGWPSIFSFATNKKSVCVSGYRSCDAVDKGFVTTEGDYLEIPLFGKQTRRRRFFTNSIFPLAGVTEPPNSKPGIFSFFQKMWAFDEESWVSYTDMVRFGEGIPESKGEMDEISSDIMNDSGTHFSSSSSTTNPKKVGANINVEENIVNEDSRDSLLNPTVKISCENSYMRFKSFVPSLEHVSETQAYLFPKGDRKV